MTGRTSLTGPARTQPGLPDTAPSGPTDQPQLRVAVVTPYFAPHVGGVEKYAEQVARGLAERADLQTLVITTGDRLRTSVQQHGSLRVVRLGRWLRLSNTPVNPCWPWQLARLFRRYQVQVLHLHSPVPFLADAAMLAAGRPGRLAVVLTYHAGTLVKGSSGLVDHLLRWYERRVLPLLFRRADELVAVSPTSLAHRTGRATVISPGVDPEQFRPDAAAEPPAGPDASAEPPAGPDASAEPPAGPGSPTLLFVGRMERSSAWKGVPVLVEAFAEVCRRTPQARLVLAGGGDAVPDHLEQARRLGLSGRVTWAGELAPAELARAYRAATMLVLPSLTAAESFGMTLIEAMASGRPVVGSDVGGIPSVIRDGVDGLLVPPGDPVALADACTRLLADPRLAARMGRQGRLAAETRFGWPARIDAHAVLVRRAWAASRPDAARPDTVGEAGHGP
jgi:glycosyltransferase involved in cell wall biosynthesis